MSIITITYQPDRDRFEMRTPRTVYVLQWGEVEDLAYDIRNAEAERMEFLSQSGSEGN